MFVSFLEFSSRFIILFSPTTKTPSVPVLDLEKLEAPSDVFLVCGDVLVLSEMFHSVALNYFCLFLFLSSWRPNQTKPDQTRLNQTKPDQTRPNQTKPAVPGQSCGETTPITRLKQV
ncbi:hypothetical protein NL108_018083 [Boleophthalmus pectinirostris]|nr:hypothetical protein NL108_018083 [Boleophthalmus pectinirostris]